MKSGNIEFLEKIKDEFELKECTFKPIINKKTSSQSRERAEKEIEEEQKQVWQRLHAEQIESKDWAKIENEKMNIEMKDCTFTP